MPISKGENLQLLQFDVSGGSETRQPLGVAQCNPISVLLHLAG